VISLPFVAAYRILSEWILGVELRHSVAATDEWRKRGHRPKASNANYRQRPNPVDAQANLRQVPWVNPRDFFGYKVAFVSDFTLFDSCLDDRSARSQDMREKCNQLFQ
jgi:hypothetical protein